MPLPQTWGFGHGYTPPFLLVRLTRHTSRTRRSTAQPVCWIIQLWYRIIARFGNPCLTLGCPGQKGGPGAALWMCRPASVPAPGEQTFPSGLNLCTAARSPCPSRQSTRADKPPRRPEAQHRNRQATRGAGAWSAFYAPALPKCPPLRETADCRRSNRQSRIVHSGLASVPGLGQVVREVSPQVQPGMPPKVTGSDGTGTRLGRAKEQGPPRQERSAPLADVSSGSCRRVVRIVQTCRAGRIES
jgi:hypothetical protein